MAFKKTGVGSSLGVVSLPDPSPKDTKPESQTLTAEPDKQSDKSKGR